LRVALGKFARSRIEASLGGDPAATVRAALLHYERRMKSRTPPPGLPDLAKGPQVAGDPSAYVEFEVNSAVRALLEEQAKSEGVDLNRIVAHAVLVYLADLDLDSPPGRTPDTKGVPEGRGHHSPATLRR